EEQRKVLQIELVASFAQQVNLLKEGEQAGTCEVRASGAHGPKTLSSRACPSSTRLLGRAVPCILLTAPLSYVAVASHLSPCEKLLRSVKRAPSARAEMRVWYPVFKWQE